MYIISNGLTLILDHRILLHYRYVIVIMRCMISGDVNHVMDKNIKV